MVYKNNYFKKEFKGAFFDKKINWHRMVLYSLIISLFAFVSHLVLVTLHDTVIVDIFPSIADKSFFSVGYIYCFFALLFFVFYFIYYRQYFTFSEIHENRWYMLLKQGYKAERMIGAKIAARLIFIGIVYTLGYIFVQLYTIFLLYDYNILNMISLYVAGLFDVLFATLIIMAISLYINNARLLKMISFAIVVFIFILKLLTNYNTIGASPVAMQNIFNLLITPYFLIIFAAALGTVVVILLKAKNLANYYFPKPLKQQNIIIKDFKTDAFLVKYKKTHTAVKVAKIATSVLMGIAIAMCLVFNVVLLTMTVSQSTVKMLFGDRMPVLYEYTIMSPIIEKNDVALFKPYTKGDELKEGDAILFTGADGTNYIKAITKIEGDIVHLKYLHAEDSKNFTTSIGSIVGVHVENNRTLGAVLVFTNSLAGRIVLLVIPVIWLFFGDYIISKINKKRRAKTYIDETRYGKSIDKDSIDINKLEESN